MDLLNMKKGSFEHFLSFSGNAKLSLEKLDVFFLIVQGYPTLYLEFKDYLTDIKSVSGNKKNDMGNFFN